MMRYELHISKEDILQLQDHAEMNLPEESVALIFGTISENIVRANRVELVENESKSRHTTFSVNPELEYQLLVESEERGEELVGIFHSHPAPPKPSKTDLRNMKLNPVVWVISSKLTGSWISKAHVLQNGISAEIPIRIQNSIS